MTWTAIIIFTIVICLVAGVAEYRAQQANEIPFSDTSEIEPEADSARFHGHQEGTAV